jgi:hypothetical protein
VATVCTARFNIQQFYALPTQSVYVFCVDLGTNSDYFPTSMLVPGEPGGLGTPVYVFTMETPRPVEARHDSCTQLLWKPHDPSRQDTPIYLVTFETSRPVGTRNSSCRQLLQKPHDQSRKGTLIYFVTFQTSRPMETRHNSCKQLLWNHRDPGRQRTPISVVTAETRDAGRQAGRQARLTHLRSYRRNLKNVHACV